MYSKLESIEHNFEVMRKKSNVVGILSSGGSLSQHKQKVSPEVRKRVSFFDEMSEPSQDGDE